MSSLSLCAQGVRGLRRLERRRGRLTLGLSKEVAGEGIRVNGVRPAFIHTDIHASGGEPGRVDRIKDTIPIRRGGRPKEVA